MTDNELTGQLKPWEQELPTKLLPAIPLQDAPRSLFSLAEDYANGRIKPPLHQRGEDAWPPSKRKEWINRCSAVLSGKAQAPLGIVCLYRIQQDPSQTFLNEGLQRISSAAEALAAPQRH